MHHMLRLSTSPFPTAPAHVSFSVRLVLMPCRHCPQRGHNASACPKLAKQLLQSALQKVRVDYTQQHLTKGGEVSLKGAPSRSQHSAKRKASKGAFGKFATAATPPAAELENEAEAEAAASHEVQEYEGSEAHCSPDCSSVQRLLTTKWAWRCARCPCGGAMKKVKVSTAAQRKRPSFSAVHSVQEME